MFLLQNMFYTFVLLPKSIPQKFSIFFELFKTVTSRFSMFETCNCQSSFFFLELFASALLFTFVENELSLEP